MKTKRMWILVGIAALGLYVGMAAATETQLPEECLEPNLSPEVQRFCDLLRFADVPHYHVVRHAPTGAVRSIHLIDTVTGREIVTSYPHGIKFAIADDLTPGESDREVRVRTEELQGVLEAAPTPAPPVPAPMGFATGLPIGWNSSTGLTPGQCLNYTIAPLSNNVEQASFSSQNTANSTAQQINVSATVSLAFDLFSASDTFSFSDQWQSSTNSSNQYYNFYSLYTLNTTVPPSDPLNAQGQNAGTSFNTLCGSDYLSSVPVGMVATVSINYGSTSTTTAQSITNTLTASFGLDSVSTAVGVASQDTSSSSYFTFSMVLYGGGTAAAQALHDAFAKLNTGGEAFYALCAQGNAQACTQFTSNIGQGAAAALSSFHQLVAGLSSATNPDLSFLQTFPSGVAGASTPQAVTTPIPLQTSDVLAPYKPQLEEVLTLVNQISTLNNRVRLLQGLLESVPSFNPAAFLDLVSYLDRLENIYRADRNTLTASLQHCLQATSTNVQTVCQPIINNQATNAFEYYAANGPGNNFFAQQNTLALQYTGVHTLQEASPLPQDVIYIDQLPSFAAQGSPVPIAGEAAFVSFVDRPVPGPGGTLPLVDILALEPDALLSTNNVSTKVRTTAAPSPFTLYEASIGGVNSLPPASFTSVSCTPTFTQPCAINYFFSPGGGLPQPKTVENRQIQDLFD
jgi:hypothetical protein